MKLHPFMILSVLVLSPLLARAGTPPPPATNNLIRNGGFELDADESASVPGWGGNDGKCDIKRHADGSAYLVIANAVPNESAGCGQNLELRPEWKQLKVSVRAKIEAVTPGKEGWHDCRVALAFPMDKGSTTYGTPFIWKTAAPEWTTYTKIVDIPAGAKSANFSIAFFGSTGSASFDDFTVEALPASTVAVAPAAAPAEQLPVAGTTPAAAELGWAQEPLERESPVREAICLNGLWRFAPDKAAAKPDYWGVIRVPGSWTSWGGMPGVERRGQGWPAKWPESFHAWYEREMSVPAEWTGRRVVLDCQRISTDALVYVNGKRAGQLTWPGGELDLTAFCAPGKTARLTMLVEAKLLNSEVVNYMGPAPEQITKGSASLHSKGIIGDVLLRSLPAKGHVTSLKIQTSTRKKNLTLDLTLNGVAAGAELAVTADLHNATGALEKSFTTHVKVGTEGTAQASWPWSDPTLWDIDRPSLYQIDLRVTGAGVADHLSRTFGFREFWIEGKSFFLNGVPIRLRPSVPNGGWICGSVNEIRAELQALKAQGYTLAELPWDDKHTRGTFEFDEIWAAEADRVGILLAASALDANELIKDKLVNPRMIQVWKNLVSRRLNGLVNHPSIVLWIFAGNHFGLGEDQNPELLGNRAAVEKVGEPWLRTLRSPFAALAALKELDPTRPAFSHAGSFVGDLYTANNYLCLTPLQEREDWLSAWAAHGDMPYMACEFGLPFSGTFLRGRRGFPESEPLATEYAAIYFGAQAYRLEDQTYRDFLRDSFIKDFQYEGTHFYTPLGALRTPTLSALAEMFNRNTWRSWRTYGISGGMVPWGTGEIPRLSVEITTQPFQNFHLMEKNPAPFRPGQRGTYHGSLPRQSLYPRQSASTLTSPAAQTLLANNQETLAWIAGAGESFTDKSHLFSPGEKVRKQVALLNDTRHPQAYSWRTKALCGGQVIDTASETGTIEPGQTLLRVFSFTVPAGQKDATSSGEIAMEAHIAGNGHTDSFHFDVIQPPEPAKGELRVADPAGETSTMLSDAGWKVRPWHDEPGLVVIGRRALEQDPALSKRLEQHVRNGGRALLMAQDPQWLKDRIGWRVALHLARRVFPLASAAPAWGGFDAESLRDWRGDSKLLAPTNTAIKDATQLRPARKFGWRWGGRGAVSSCAVEKPHHGGWTPLLECEFDLAYSPLMQLSYGKGLLVFCGLDLEDHSAHDPAAKKALAQVIQAARDTVIEPRRPTSFIGNAADEALLQQSGLLYHKATALPAGASLAVLSADAAVTPAALASFARNGGRVLVMAARQDGLTAHGVTLRKNDKFAGSLDVPDWPVCRGLSASDLRWRTTGPAYLLSGGCDTAAAGLLGHKQIGKGEIVYCQLDPALLDADVKTYMRFTRWRETRALSQLLANLGAAFQSDNGIFQVAAPAPDLFYHKDYRGDFQLGDDPYRYYRW
ncbi:MAG: sugar-binding domain-containing protein [Verrucomicrobiota bacterium]